MAILSIFVFGSALAASTYAIFTTVRPELARIADLLTHGPVLTAPVRAAVPPRGSARAVMVRSVTAAAQQRAAA